jgi:alpha-amylase
MKKIYLFLILWTFTGLLSACETQEEVIPLAYPEYRNYYQILVRSFADSDGDGMGDFTGIKENLDYFVDLGVNGLWLLPIHPSGSYHGYDVEDYYDVNPDYGTMEEFEALVAAALEKDIVIMMDFVINHSSDQHPWFQAFLRNEAPYDEFYRKIPATSEMRLNLGSWGQSVWHATGDGDFYAGYFGGYMPDLNWSNPAVVDEVVAIGEFWAEKGVQGFRIDAALHIFGLGEMPANFPLIDETLFQLELMKFRIQETYPETFFIGEVWDSASIYQIFHGPLDSVFHFDFGHEVVQSIQQGFSRTYVDQVVRWHENALMQSENAIQAPFLRNHDQNRIASGSEPGTLNLGPDPDKLRLAAEMLLTVPGIPFIYYGEELGMRGERSMVPPTWDSTTRLPFLWPDERKPTWVTDQFGYVDQFNVDVADAESQQADPESLFSVYQTLLHLRLDYPVLRVGSIRAFEDNHPGIQGFYREQEGYPTLLVIHNLTDETLSVPGVDRLGSLLYGSLNTNEIAPQSTVIIEIASE